MIASHKNKTMMKPIALSSTRRASTLSDAVRLDLSGNMGLFGRDNEMKTLRDAFSRIVAATPTTSSTHTTTTQESHQEESMLMNAAPELVLVGGASGTGKSSLVKAALEKCTRFDNGGFFIKGKFDQFSNEGTSDSCSALLEALTELCKLVKTHKDRDTIVQSIRVGLGDEVGRLSTFIPELRDLLLGSEKGKYEIPDSRQGTVSYTRFKTLCCIFVTSIASVQHPVVLFIDDLQWGDCNAINLIRVLLRNERTAGLLIVGSYRDNEVGDDHPLSIGTKKILETDTVVSKISLTCLDEGTVNTLIAFATKLKLEETEPFSRLVHHKTDGNCFGVTQFLEMLQEERLLRFSFTTYKWDWTLDEIAAKTNINDTVVDLVIARISKLDPKSREIFKIAGCLGPHFPVDVLHII
jgi:predicted ATPase